MQAGCCDVEYVLSRVCPEVRASLAALYGIEKESLALWFKNRASKTSKPDSRRSTLGNKAGSPKAHRIAVVRSGSSKFLPALDCVGDDYGLAGLGLNAVCQHAIESVDCGDAPSRRGARAQRRAPKKHCTAASSSSVWAASFGFAPPDSAVSPFSAHAPMLDLGAEVGAPEYGLHSARSIMATKGRVDPSPFAASAVPQLLDQRETWDISSGEPSSWLLCGGDSNDSARR